MQKNTSQHRDDFFLTRLPGPRNGTDSVLTPTLMEWECFPPERPFLDDRESGQSPPTTRRQAGNAIGVFRGAKSQQTPLTCFLFPVLNDKVVEVEESWAWVLTKSESDWQGRAGHTLAAPAQPQAFTASHKGDGTLLYLWCHFLYFLPSLCITPLQNASSRARNGAPSASQTDALDRARRASVSIMGKGRVATASTPPIPGYLGLKGKRLVNLVLTTLPSRLGALFLARSPHESFQCIRSLRDPGVVGLTIRNAGTR
jgi:hypothetical protein